MNNFDHKIQPRPLFADNTVVRARPEQYTEILVDTQKVLKSFKASLFAHELLEPDGRIKTDQHLSETRLEKRIVVKERLLSGLSLEKPILGIGVFDNIEIGAGSDILATLALEGIEKIPVHVRVSQLKDFKAFKPD
jgi:hypothetical protein